jgi:hypothetical protein
VTRFGDFSSIGQFLENYRSSSNFGATFFHSASYVFIFVETWIVLNFG